jgi:hypothetical protein
VPSDEVDVESVTRRSGNRRLRLAIKSATPNIRGAGHPLLSHRSPVTELMQISRDITPAWRAGRDLNPEPVD